MTRFTRWCQRISLTGGAAVVFFAAPLIAWVICWNVGNAVIFGTGVVVLLYTYETYQMRRQMVRQNELAVQPLLLATIERRPVGHDTSDWRVVLRNIGRGPAIHIRGADVEIPKDNPDMVGSFETVDCLEPGKDTVMEVLDRWKDSTQKRVLTSFIAELHPQFGQHTYDVQITYDDVEGQRWASIVRMGKGGIKLLANRKVHEKEH